MKTSARTINPEQATTMLAALEASVRAGFAVTLRPGDTGGVVVEVKSEVVTVGTASARVKPFTVAAEHVREAAGNALAVLFLEIGQDRLAKVRAVEESEAESA